MDRCAQHVLIEKRLRETFETGVVRWRDIQNGAQARVSKAIINVFNNGTVQVQGARHSKEYQQLMRLKEECDDSTRKVESVVSSPKRSRNSKRDDEEEEEEEEKEETVERMVVVDQTENEDVRNALAEISKTLRSSYARLRRLDLVLKKMDRRSEEDHKRLLSLIETVKALVPTKQE